MPAHPILRIKIPIEKEDSVIEKKASFTYVPVYINDIRLGNIVYTFVDKMYIDYEIDKEPYSFTSSPGIKTTFMFGCTEEPIRMIGLLTAGSNYVKVYCDAYYIFVPLYKRVNR